ncbi:MAG TPA: cytochrome c oxidase subunit II [Steroidobacteraceae bacterium]|nr:cytochrome c oxidase subunit II [Steroidobacteraceae bacterium]
MHRARLGILGGTLALLATAAGAPVASAQSGWSLLNLPVGVTDVSRKIYGLHMMAFWICVGIAVVVFGVMIWSLIFHRRSRGAVADVTLIHNTKVEVIWTAVPVLILISMAVPAANLLVKINDNSHAQLDIKVTGFQWGWQYTYMKSGVSFVSKLAYDTDAARQLGSGINPDTVKNYLLDVDHPLVVPTGTKVRLLITSVDVIHSWWLPDFGVKRDALPGFINEVSFTVDPGKLGVYRGQCTELCGRDHAYMPVVVRTVSPADFAAWLKRQQALQKQGVDLSAQTIAAPAG